MQPLPTADPQLQQIAQLCEQTLLACLQDSFVDSAWRESSLWLGDALPQALILHAMTGDTRPLRQALTLHIHDRTLFMKGIDVSYYYEGYSEFKTEAL